MTMMNSPKKYIIDLDEESRKFSKRFNIAVSVVLIFTVVSGAFRKWVFPTGNAGTLIFGLQLLVPVAILLINGDEKLRKEVKPAWENMFFLTLILLAFNPLSQSIFHGIIGFYMYSLFYLIMRKYFIYKDHIHLKSLFWVILGIAGLEFILGSAQYFLPPTHILNYQIKIKGLDPGIARVGDNIRVSGTFSYLAGYGTFVSLVGYLVWSQLVLRTKLVWLVPFALAGIGCALFSGSRGAIINFLIFAVFGLSGYLLSIKQTIRLVFFVSIAFVILSYFEFGGFSDKFNTGVQNISTRFGDTDKLEESDLGARSLTPVFAIFGFDLPVGFNLFGIGLSATYQGTNIIWGTSEAAKMVGGWEDEVGRVLIEGGYLMYLFRVLIMIYVVRKMQWPKWMIFPFFLYLFFFTQTVINIYSTTFTFLGLMFVDNAYRDINLEKLKELTPSETV